VALTIVTVQLIACASPVESVQVTEKGEEMLLVVPESRSGAVPVRTALFPCWASTNQLGNADPAVTVHV
jgi:hypothetical protein